MSRLLLFLVTVTLLSSATRAVPTANQLPVEMEPFVVKVENTRFDNWSKVFSKHFILYTDLGESGACALLEKMEKLYVVGEKLLGRPLSNSARHIFILPSSSSDWSKLEAARHTEWKPVAGIIWHEPQRVSVMREVPLLGQLLTRTEDSYYFQSLIGMAMIRDAGLSQNLWLERAFALVIGNAHVKEDHVELGGVISSESHLAFRDYIPWETYFRVNPLSPEYVTRAGIRKLNAQCALVGRFFFFSRDENLPKVYKWAQYLADGGEPTEAEFKKRFGLGWPELERELRVVHRQRKKESWELKPDEVDSKTRIEAIAPREMQQLFLLVQTLGWKKEDASGLLDHLLTKSLATPLFETLLADACLRLDRKQSALEALQRAAEKAPETPLILEYRARLLMEMYAPLSNLDARYAGPAEEIPVIFKKVMETDPARLAVRDLLLRYEAFAQDLPADFVNRLSNLIAQETPGRKRSAHEFLLAFALWRSGEIEAARKHAESVITDPKAAPDTKKAAAALKARLP